VARIAHPYLHTRVSLLARRLLDPAEFAAALDRPVEASREFFRAIGAEALISDDPRQARRSLEQRRLALVLDDAMVIVRALSGASREFIRHWVHLLELVNLKAILHGRLTGRDPLAIRDGLFDMGPLAALPVEALLRAENELEVLARLDGTPYADIGRQARRVLEERRDLFFLDTTFDRRFFGGLVERAAKLHVHDPAGLRALMEALVDGTNLVWLLRYRFVYGLPPAETYYLLIPTDYRLGGRQLRALAGLPSLATVLAALPAPLARATRGAESIEDVGARMERRLRATAHRLLAHSVSALTRAFAYLLLRERDLKLVRGMMQAELMGIAGDVRREALRLPAPPGVAHA